MDLNALRDRVKAYFDISSYLLPQDEAETAIRDGVSFRGMTIIILIIAILIACLGLNTNSVSVLIGAMLISPLMGPILGLGLAVGVKDFELMKRSFRNIGWAALFSVAASTIYFLISPVNESHSELLARTTPTIYDVFVGFFGGAAGILAIGSKFKGNVIPGVAIATALMPPLCTVGYGIATWQLHYFLGALYLFFINSVFIALATYVGVKLMKYAPHASADPARATRVRRTVYFIAILTMLPAVWLTYRMLLQNTFTQNCERFVASEFVFPNTSVLSYRSNWAKDQKTLTVALMGEPLAQDSLLAAMDARLPQYHLSGTRLKIIQGSQMQDVDMTKTTSSMLGDIYTMSQATINRQRSEIDSLQTRLAGVEASDTAGAMIAPEVKVMFPQVSDIAVTRAVICQVDSARLDTVSLALVTYSQPMPRSQQQKFREYLQARLHTTDIRIVQL